MASLLGGLGSVRRSLRIWLSMLRLLAGLWADGADWTYRGGVTPERRAARQQRRTHWLTAELLGLG